jgi:hypothetical protein
MKDRVTHINHPTALNSLQSQRKSDVQASLKKEASVVPPSAVQLLQVGAGGHVFDIERVIRCIKERFRALLSSLMFHFGRLHIVFGILFIVGCLNFQVSSTSMNNMSPRQAVLGMATNGATAFRFQFASACTVSEGPSIPFFTVLNPPLSGGIRGVSDENRGAILSTVPVPPSQVVEDTVHPSLSISVQAPDINHATLGPSPPTGGRSLLENFRVGIENSSFVTADEYDKECKRQDGPYLGYLGMNFDFSILGVASVTMKGYIHDLFLSYGVEGGAKTPASDTLFHIRESGVPDNPIATTVQAKDFHRQVARVPYLAKRVMPECLTAVSLLSTRVTRCDSDDLNKLVRLLRYIRSNAHRGIRFSSSRPPLFT